MDTPSDEIGVMEAVVTPNSQLVGSSVRSAQIVRPPRGQSVGGESQRPAHRPPFARGKTAGRRRHRAAGAISPPCRRRWASCIACRWPSATCDRPQSERAADLVLAAAMGLVAFNVVPVAIAFFGAAVILLLARSLSLREAYDAIEWPILIMLGALIPVSDALRTTGGTDLIAAWLSRGLGPAADGDARTALVAAMAVTPFLNNAATVLVVAPIAASFAGRLGYNPDPFLMAVAIGAACDFLTPIGHQCNTLVMGPGGYRFGDYWRLGLPLSLIVLLVGVPLIAFFWPF